MTEGSGAERALSGTGSSSIDTLLQRTARRLRLQRSIGYAVWGVMAASVVATAIVVYHRLYSPQWELVPPLAGVLVGVPLLVALVAFVVIHRDPLRAALALERQYTLHERFSSILFLRREPVGEEAAHALIRDGERHVSGVDLRKATPWRRPRGTWSALFFAVFFAGTFFFLPTFDLHGEEAKRVAAKEEKKRVDEKKEKLVKRMREIRKAAEKRDIDVDTKKILKKIAERQQLEQSKKQTPNARRQALVDLDRMRQELNERRTRPAMKGLEKYLDNLKTQGGTKFENERVKDAAKALSQGDLDKAASALKDLAEKLKQAKNAKGDMGKLSELDAEALASLMKDMDKLAPLLKDLPGLNKEQLQKGLSGMKPSDLAKLGENAADSLEQLARLMREQETLDQAMDEIEFTADELASLPQEWAESEPCETCKKAGAKPGGG